MDIPQHPPLILASSSAYRQALLSRLRLPFQHQAPDLDETPLDGEAPAALAVRLALAKAQAIFNRHPDAIVIGSDQVAELDGQPLGKPGDHARAVQQLQAMQGRTLVFHTALAVLSPTHAPLQRNVPTTCRMRPLSPREIEAYLRADTPYDCAGSAKIESLGACLLDTVESADPTALIGLPLLTLNQFLLTLGINPLLALEGNA
ncbi:MAG: Maf family nucleotide pyrophosphatase [Pigmentiphaga sp.]|nr:Maf family nucleotide pyrophosphatase [Pigmentiphaga sp.]